MGSITSKSEATRLRIIDGALHVLATQGVQAATTRAIATAAGVRLATLHYHFASKDALLATVLEALIAQLTQALRAEVRPEVDLPGRAEEIHRAAWRLALRTRALQIVQYEVTLYALRTPGARWIAAHQYACYVETYASILAGGGPVDAGVRDLARLVLAGIDGLILQELANPDRRRAARTLHRLIDSARDMAHGLQSSAASMRRRAA